MAWLPPSAISPFVMQLSPDACGAWTELPPVSGDQKHGQGEWPRGTGDAGGGQVNRLLPVGGQSARTQDVSLSLAVAVPVGGNLGTRSLPT